MRLPFPGLTLPMIRYWFGGTIARKLLLAFFSIFIITYLVTALVVQNLSLIHI